MFDTNAVIKTRLAYCIDFLIEHSVNCSNVLGTLELTTGCLIRLCRDVNAHLAILLKFCVVFLCGNEKPQTNFYIPENNIISTHHELNLNRFWDIPHGQNVNWKFATKCDIWILKYCWFSWTKFICLYSGPWFPPFYGYQHSFQFREFSTTKK